MTDSSPSLTRLLQHADNRLRLFDMGRRVSKLSVDTFARIEQNEIPYPSPFLHHAWIGFLIWNPAQKEQSLIWFLKFPLDEQGFLIQAARDDMVNRLLQNVLSNQGEQATGDALKDNPFAFTPDQEKMATFHALATRATGSPASQYYEEVQQYISGQRPDDYWQNLGFQGIADFTTRLDKGDNEASLCRAISHLPEQPLQIIARLLEHAQPSHDLGRALASRLHSQLTQEQPVPELVAALIRGLSNCRSQSLTREEISKVLQHPCSREPEVIAAIGSRCIECLQYPDILKLFLEQLARGKAGQTGFSRIITDLMFSPVMRALIMQAFRHPERSEALSQAIGEMFGSTFVSTSGSGTAH